MGTNELGLQEMTQVMTALNSYREMGTWIGGSCRDQPALKEWYDKQLEMYGDKKKYIGQQWYDTWTDADMHIVNQTWSSTACGWGGIGGAAMTSAYTVVIVNYNMKIVCIYWGGKLAYIAELNEKVNTCKWESFPGLGSTGKIDVIYKPGRK